MPRRTKQQIIDDQAERIIELTSRCDKYENAVSAYAVAARELEKTVDAIVGEVARQYGAEKVQAEGLADTYWELEIPIPEVDKYRVKAQKDEERGVYTIKAVHNFMNPPEEGDYGE